MVTTIIVSVITFILIITSLLIFPTIKIGEIHIDSYWTIALVGAIVLLVCQKVPFDEVIKELTASNAINPIKILILFFSMTIISIFLDEFGLFRYLACRATRKAKGNQYILFFVFYGLTSILTVFTSNDVVILTLTPFICFFCKNAKINPLPYLIAEFAGANTWSLMFIIGNPTNIYLATSANITFIEYFEMMIIPTIAAGITEIIIIFFLFKNKLRKSLEISEEKYQIPNKIDLFVGIFHLLVCLVFLVISSYIHLEMWLISLISALSLLAYSIISRIITNKNWNCIFHSLKRLPYQLIPFFLSMFVIVVAINYQGISKHLADFLGNKNTIFVYGYSSFISCNVINNIPMSILFSNLATHLSDQAYIEAIYASIVGSNIGAFLTPIGALAGIMFSHLVKEHNIKFSFIDFSKYGIIIAIPTITICLVALFLVF